MLYNNEDEFLNLLANKISQVTPKQPTEGDWESFDKAYRAHKQTNKKRKLIVIFWFSALTFILFGFNPIYLNTNVYTNNLKNIDNKEFKERKVASKQLPVTYNQKVAISVKKENEKSVNIIENPNINKNRFENKKNFKANIFKPSNQKLLAKTNIENGLIVKLRDVTDLAIGNYNYDFTMPELINIENKNIYSSKINFKNIDSAKNETIKIKRKLKANVAYLELSYLLQSNVYKQPKNSSDQYFNGVGANAGLRINNNWSLNFGLSALFLNKTEMKKSVFETTEKHIESIDTTIKYNAFYNRLMMQIDTVTSEKNVVHRSNNSYQNRVAFYNLPIQVRYQIGNKKHSFYASFGVTGTLVYQLETNVNNVGLVNETIKTNNNYQMLFAPSLGVGAHQKIYNNWAFHISANYLKYLDGSLYQPNIFQLQTGLQYNF